MMFSRFYECAEGYSFGTNSKFPLQKQSEYITASSQILTTKAKSSLSKPVSEEWLFNLKVFSTLRGNW